jgi:TRAP-type C4-dicarboxylate transport system substrate-binding protein
MPALLTDKKIAQQVLKSDFRTKLNEKYEEAGFKLLMIAPTGFREMSSNVKVDDISDFSGVKIRTMENKYHLAFWKALGANPSPLAFSELYIALQQGLVDAQENPYATIVSAKLYEQQDYVVNTNHIMFLSTTVMNKGLYDGLPEDLKAVVDEVFAEASEIAFEIGQQESDKARKVLEDAGVEFIDMTDEQFAEIQEIAKPVYDMVREDIGDELVDSLLTELEAAKQ